ncbi:RNA ligase [uncultured archaeon]|nr:RNA ligase [uncultured archaeon]
MAGAEEMRAALAKGAAERGKFGALEYVRFRSPYREIERGSVAIKGGFYPGFPHIKRIFTLENGLEKNISSERVFAEEKIDGYNLRCVSIGNEIYALSRGGIIDAFSTEKLRGIVPRAIFQGNVMLCGEMIGNTPYTRPTNEFDVKYYVFDIYDLEEGEYLPPEERYALLKRHGLEPAPSFGKFHKKGDLKKLRALALNVNKSGKEGIVFKSEDRTEVVKYVNPNADIEDVGSTIKAIFDMPTGQYNQRILRSAIFIREYGLGKEEYGCKLGKSIYENFAKGLDMLEREGSIYDEFEILVKDTAVWDELRRHMSHEIRLETVFEREEKEGTRIKFRKIYVKSTRKLREFLNGKGITD